MGGKGRVSRGRNGRGGANSAYGRYMCHMPIEDCSGYTDERRDVVAVGTAEIRWTRMSIVRRLARAVQEAPRGEERVRPAHFSIGLY